MLTRLLVLWVLSEGPLHGYRILRALAEGPLSRWFPLHAASIYSMLRTLEKERLVRTGEPTSEGARPPKTVYAITRLGREAYRDLLRRAWTELPAPGDALDVALMSPGELDATEIAALAAARRAALGRRRDELARDLRALPSAAMGARGQARIDAELRWLAARPHEDPRPDEGGR